MQYWPFADRYGSVDRLFYTHGLGSNSTQSYEAFISTTFVLDDHLAYIFYFKNVHTWTEYVI